MTLLSVLMWLGMVIGILLALTMIALTALFVWIMVEAVRQAIGKQKERK